MLRFIGVEINNCPHVLGVSPLSILFWKKFSLAFAKPKREAKAQNSVPSVPEFMSKLIPVQSLPLCGLALFLLPAALQPA